MKDSLKKDINFTNLIKFTMPTIFMMVFMSMYTIVDGIFVANLIGTNALSAINLVMPFISVTTGLSVMMASGGCAIVMCKMGQKQEKNARQDFTLIIIATLILGVIVTVFSYTFFNPILKLLGATEILIDYCRNYLFFIILFAVPTLLKFVFEQFMVAAGYSKLAFFSTVLGGVTNIVLDYVFIAILGMGLEGAAIATGIGYAIPCVIGFIFFFSKKSQIYFEKPKWQPKILLKTCTNGSSEMLSSVSAGIITFLFNKAMLSYLGEDGVAAITIIMYAEFLISAIYMGYSMGVSPMISYYYGSENIEKLKKLMKHSFVLIAVTSIVTFVFAFSNAGFLVRLFVKSGTVVYKIAVEGFRYFALSFLFVGNNIFIGGMFTALSDGKISAILSVNKNLVSVLIWISLLPVFLQVTGVWLAIPFAEGTSVLLAFILYKRYKSKYQY